MKKNFISLLEEMVHIHPDIKHYILMIFVIVQHYLFYDHKKV